MSPPASPVILYDGSCGLCASSVQFILRHERRHSARFAPLQGRFAASVRLRHPRLKGVDSMVWIEPTGDGAGERVFLRSSAALRAALYVGGVWRLLGLGFIVPRPLRDAVYDFIARHRHRMVGDSCFLPSPDVRGRFME